MIVHIVVMKFLFNILSKLFDNNSKIVVSDEDINKSIVSNIVSKYSRGNINLQFGRYSLQKDIDARRKEIRDYKFKGLPSKA